VALVPRGCGVGCASEGELLALPTVLFEGTPWATACAQQAAVRIATALRQPGRRRSADTVFAIVRALGAAVPPPGTGRGGGVGAVEACRSGRD